VVIFQQMGFGVGVPLLIDATIVSSVLVPASMKLLGDWNWYLPAWLRWLPEVHVEGRAAAEPASTATTKPPESPARPPVRDPAFAGPAQRLNERKAR